MTNIANDTVYIINNACTAETVCLYFYAVKSAAGCRLYWLPSKTSSVWMEWMGDTPSTVMTTYGAKSLRVNFETFM